MEHPERIRTPRKVKAYDFSRQERTPPDYARTFAALSTADLQAEVDAGRGDDAYQEAARAALAARRAARPR